MNKEHYIGLIKELGATLKLNDLVPDEELYVSLGFDDKVQLHIQYNEESDIILLFSQLGEVDEDKLGDIAPKLLQANLFWQGSGGATIGMDQDSREVILAYQVKLGDTAYERFEGITESFVNTAEIWVKTLSEYQSGSLEPQEIV